MSVESPFTPTTAFRPIQPSPVPSSTPTSDIIDIPESGSDDEYGRLLDYVISINKTDPGLDSLLSSITIQTDAYNRIKTKENNPQPPVLFQDWVPNAPWYEWDKCTTTWKQLTEAEFDNLKALKDAAVAIMKKMSNSPSPFSFSAQSSITVG